MEELSIKSILKALIPKLKMLLIVLLVGFIAGGCIGVARTYSSRFYGTTIEFYVNPKKSDDVEINSSQYGVYGAYGWHVMDNMTKLLASESFAEELLLDERGLPIDEVLNKEFDRTAINEKIEAAIGPIDEAEAAKEAAELAAETTAEKQIAYSEAASNASKAYNKYISFVNSGADADTVAAALRESENASALEQDAKAKLEAAKLDQQQKEEVSKEKLKESNQKISEVLEFWRTSEVYKQYLTTIKRSVSYTFYNENEIQINNAEALAKSFIYVNIAVSKDEEFANFMFERINEVLPVYVEANMAVPSGYVGTNCQRITRLDDIRQTDSGELVSSALKMGFVFGILALIVGAVAVVVVDRAKKWIKVNGNIFSLSEEQPAAEIEAQIEEDAEEDNGESEENSEVDWQ